MATQYVLTCSEPWQRLGSVNNPRYLCQGTLQNTPTHELNPDGLSAEDWAEYRGHVLMLFVVVFVFLACKKVLFPR